jgi:hypothetical protein
MAAFGDLPPGVRSLLERMGIREESYSDYVRKIESSTAERERDGENDHLVFYLLQSRQFTKVPPIEPAVSAKAFVTTGVIPADAERRMQAFSDSPLQNERMTYLKRLVPAKEGRLFLRNQYERAMRSIYSKEFAATPDFYQSRGHSTDSQIPANFGVWNALSVLRRIDGSAKGDRVLVIGPGLDFAPRTGLNERYPPQSYQPYAVADALIGLDFAVQPRIHCLDINERVLDFFASFPHRHERVLHLSSQPGDQEYLDYFEQLGRSIGDVTGNGPLEKSVRVRREVAEAIDAEKLNIIVERRAGGYNIGYNIAIATNVFLYFSDPELLLALANIHSMLTPGGYLIDNEIRPQMDELVVAAGFHPVQARTIRIASGERAPLYDAFAIYQK